MWLQGGINLFLHLELIFKHALVIHEYNFFDNKRHECLLIASLIARRPDLSSSLRSDCSPILSHPVSGGLRPPQAAVLPNDRRLPHLLLGGEPCQFPERARRMGARVAGVRAQRSLPAHRHSG